MLYFVRHGQASFGALDYDNLSALGHQQAFALGRYFQQKGWQFDAVFVGTLRRHMQTYESLMQGLGQSTPVQLRSGLNEYDSHALIAAIHPQPLPAERTQENYRQHFRLLRDGLVAWMEGASQPLGMGSYAAFVKGVTDVFDEVRTAFGAQQDARILVCTSGGPISAAVAHVLGTAPAATVEINLRLRNTSVTEFVVTPKRVTLLTLNTLAHLDATPHWETYA